MGLGASSRSVTGQVSDTGRFGIVAPGHPTTRMTRSTGMKVVMAMMSSIIAGDLIWSSQLGLIGSFLKGDHVSHPCVSL